MTDKDDKKPHKKHKPRKDTNVVVKEGMPDPVHVFAPHVETARRIRRGAPNRRNKLLKKVGAFVEEEKVGAFVEEAPTNSMGSSSSTNGPVQGFDPVKKIAPRSRQNKVLKRFGAFVNKPIT
jgi:hypothetical protein